MQLGSPPNLLYRRKRQGLLLRYGQRERVQRIEWLHLGDQLNLQVATSRAEPSSQRWLTGGVLGAYCLFVVALKLRWRTVLRTPYHSSWSCWGLEWRRMKSTRS